MLIDVYDKHSDMLMLVFDQSEKWRIEDLPVKEYNRKIGGYIIPILPNVNFLRQNFNSREFTVDAIFLIRKSISRSESVPFKGIKFHGTMDHQSTALDLSHNKPYYFFAHAMGAGKTLTLLTLAAHLHRTEGMEGLLVVCPATIRRDVWELEINKWLPELDVPYLYEICESNNYNNVQKLISRKDQRLKIIVAGIQSMSLSHGKSYALCGQFMDSHKVGMAIDESSKIKNYKSKRTKNVLELGTKAWRRWCMTGSNVTQGIHDLFAQYRFLDYRIIGHKSFVTFRNRYCKMGGFESRQIIGYKNINELMEAVRPYTHVVRKQDANDLPPKTYQVRHVEASEEQKKHYKELKDYMETQHGDELLTVFGALDRMTRLQQIAGGNFPYASVDRSGDITWEVKPLNRSPKYEELLEVLEEVDGKAIIWALFTAEIEAIYRGLTGIYGSGSVVTYYGKTEDRGHSRREFQEGNARFIIANQQTASMGLTLTAAATAIYYSNSFSYEDRIQSEDRCHRTGQVKSVTYIDLISDLEIDKIIYKALKAKKSMATYVADTLRSN